MSQCQFYKWSKIWPKSWFSTFDVISCLFGNWWLLELIMLSDWFKLQMSSSQNYMFDGNLCCIYQVEFNIGHYHKTKYMYALKILNWFETTKYIYLMLISSELQIEPLLHSQTLRQCFFHLLRKRCQSVWEFDNKFMNDGHTVV